MIDKWLIKSSTLIHKFSSFLLLVNCCMSFKRSFFVTSHCKISLLDDMLTEAPPLSTSTSFKSQSFWLSVNSRHLFSTHHFTYQIKTQGSFKALCQFKALQQCPSLHHLHLQYCSCRRDNLAHRLLHSNSLRLIISSQLLLD